MQDRDVHGAVHRRSLDEQLVGKVEGVPNREAVSFALIELKKAGMIDYDKRGGPMKGVWLTSLVKNPIHDLSYLPWRHQPDFSLGSVADGAFPIWETSDW